MGRKRITLDIDEGLLAHLDRSAEEKRLSRNQLIIDSIESTLDGLRRREIDDAFAAMEDDPGYCEELLRVELELAPESDIAWSLIEAQERTGL